MQVKGCGAQPLTLVYHMIICTAFLEFRSHLSFLWVSEFTWPMRGPPRKWLHPAAPCRILPSPRFRGERHRELLASGFTAAAPKASPSALLSKDSIVPGSRGRERELKRVMKLAAGAEAAEEVGIGPLPKTTRRRGSQTQSISVRLAVYCWSPASVLTALHEKKKWECATWHKKHT